MSDLYALALAELGDVTGNLDQNEVDQACNMIAGAGRIVVYGCGREGLQLQGFAMRLYHLGVDVAMQGDMATPPLGPGDLFLTSAGPGELSTVSALMGVAQKAGADILFLTAEPETTASGMATHVLTIPAQTMARDTGDSVTSVLPMGSLYEGAMFVLFEVMVLSLRDMLNVSPEDMRARHTNME